MAGDLRVYVIDFILMDLKFKLAQEAIKEAKDVQMFVRSVDCDPWQGQNTVGVRALEEMSGIPETEILEYLIMKRSRL